MEAGCLKPGGQVAPGEMLPATHQLTSLQKSALLENVRLVINRTIPQCKQTGRFQSVVAQLSNPRFRFLDQIPEAKQALISALEDTGVVLP